MSFGPEDRSAEDDVFTSATAEVFYVDFGDTERVSVADLRPLETQFAQLPAQVFRCSLANTQPPPESGQQPPPPPESGQSWLMGTPRKCAFLRCDRLDCESAVIEQNDEFKCSFHGSSSRSFNLRTWPRNAVIMCTTRKLAKLALDEKFIFEVD